MRNYLALNFGRVNFNFSSPSDPATESVWLTGTSLEDLGSQITWAQAQMGNFQIVDIEDLGIWYFKLDKVNFSRMWNFANARFPLNGPIVPRDPPSDETHPKDLPAENSPRKGWTDENGQKREPPPSEGGEGSAVTQPLQVPVDFLTGLILIYQKLLEVRQFSLAARLEYFIVKIVKKEPFDAKALQRLLDEIAAFVG